MTDLELVWLAGLIEGEGSFILARRASPKIVIAMADRDVIERAAALLEGRVTPKNQRQRTERGLKQQWATGVYGKRAPMIMKLLYPFMGRRRQAKIKEIIAEYAERSSTRYARAAASMRKYWAGPSGRVRAASCKTST